jgi:hypothetical protein
MIDIHIRISREFALCLAAIVFVSVMLVGVLSGGWFASRGASVDSVHSSAMASASPNLWLIQTSMTKRDVLQRFGKPMRISSDGCWWYSASRLNTSADGRTFCFRGSQVVQILHGYHDR